MSNSTNAPSTISNTGAFRAGGLFAVLFAIFIFIGAAQSAQAQSTFTVTRTDDRNTTCASGVDCSLREAVNAANSAASNDTINFAIPESDTGCTAGVCTITLTSGKLFVNSASTAGTLTITNTTGASNLLISGNNTSRVFDVDSGGNLTINGVTITNGNAVENLGGGIFNSGTVTLTNSTVSGNTANLGGGIFNSGTVTLTNSTVISNYAANDGGGIFNNGGTVTLTNSTVSSDNLANRGGGIYSNGGTVTLTNSTVSDNTANFGGGGIFNNGTMTLTNSTVSGNTVTLGGGIFNSGTLTLTNSTVSGNGVVRGRGAGIFNNGGTVTLTNSTVSGNTANEEGGGGGIFNNGGRTTLTNSTVSGNTARNGGGIFSISGTVTLTNSTVSGNTANLGGGINIFNGTLTLTNSTVSGNTAAGFGGGIFNREGTLNLTSVTVAFNSATNTGGGVYNEFGTANLSNTIVANNTAAAAPDFSGAILSTSSFNLIGNGQGTTDITNGTNSNQVGTSANPIDPKLAPLANNGGATQTHALLFGSPAIDQGNSFGLTTDQRGSARPVDNPSIINATGGNGADIGAFEVQLAPTAAQVTIGGRAMTANGRGISNVIITLTDASGTVRTARTTAFGRYRFTNVQAGETYIITAKSKRFQFSQPTQVLNVNEDMDSVNFVAY